MPARPLERLTRNDSIVTAVDAHEHSCNACGLPWPGVLLYLPSGILSWRILKNTQVWLFIQWQRILKWTMVFILFPGHQWVFNIRINKCQPVFYWGQKEKGTSWFVNKEVFEQTLQTLLFNFTVFHWIHMTRSNLIGIDYDIIILEVVDSFLS